MTNVTRAVLIALAIAPKAWGQTIDHSQGFAGASDLQLNGNAHLTGNTVMLTDGSGPNQAGSLFTKTKVNIDAFSVRFKFQFEPSSTSSYADGLTFTVQNAAPTAFGGNGSSLGYAGIATSAAVKIDGYQNPGDPSMASTGLFSAGQAPIGGDDMTCCVGLQNHYMNGVVEYDGSTLKLILSDYTNATYYFRVWGNINLSNLIGGSRLAYVGLTAGSGASIGATEVFYFNYRSLPPLVATDLGTLDLSCHAAQNVLGNAINDLGQVTGQSNVCITSGIYSQHAFVWDPVNGMQDLHTPNQSSDGVYHGVSSGNAINVHGEVAGDTYLWATDNTGATQFAQGGFLWNPSSMHVFAHPTFSNSSCQWMPSGSSGSNDCSFLSARGLNDAGQAVGWFADVVAPSNGLQHSIFEQTGTSLPGWAIPPPPTNAHSARAYAINNNGLVVGDTGDGASCLLYDTAGNVSAMPSAGAGTQSLLAVNSSAQAVGTLGSNAILWNPSSTNGLTGSFIPLFSGTSSNPANATGINDAGYVVGTRLYEDGLVRIPSTFNDGSGVNVSLEQMAIDGLITRPGGGSLLGPPSYVALNGARAINNLGQIVAYGNDGHAYLLSPPIQPAFAPSPSLVAAGHAAMTVTLNGVRFMTGATVKFNNSVRNAAVVSPTQMTVQLLASDFAVRGSQTITVTDPGSNATPGTATFTVR